MLVDERRSLIYKQVFALLDTEGTGKLSHKELYDGFMLYNSSLEQLKNDERYADNEEVQSQEPLDLKSAEDICERIMRNCDGGNLDYNDEMDYVEFLQAVVRT